uniref:Uncharacterized protein n=1 Tax=Anguilla anguilla TaxID=7936 RepID=A0A0E9QC22_ANGAN
MLPSQQFCSLMQVGLWVVLSVQCVPISTSFVFVTFSCRLSFFAPLCETGNGMLIG